jgi:hypothetical protein
MSPFWRSAFGSVWLANPRGLPNAEKSDISKSGLIHADGPEMELFSVSTDWAY